MSDDLKQAFGKILKEKREKMGYSQERLALEAGISRNTVSSLENATFQPTLETLFLLSDALDLSPEHLVKLVRLQIKP